MEGKQRTEVELIEILANPNFKITDMSINGECSKCGECCTSYLPLSQKELNIIQEYVILNDIKPQKQLLVMENKLTCPYYNGKKCLIYEVRPLICKRFYCYKKPTEIMAKEFMEDRHIPVDMWAIAEEIEEQRKKYKNEL